MNLEDRNQSGYFEHSLTVTGSNWTTDNAIGIAYQTLSGSWRFRFNITGSVSVATGTLTLTVANVSFPAYYQACSCHTGVAADVAKGRVGISNSVIVGQSGSTQTSWRLSGDVYLASKPSFIE